MRTTNMFYGYKRLCDNRMNGYMRRRHSDGIVESIQALLEKVKNFISSLVEKIMNKFKEVKGSPVPPTPEAKKSFKEYIAVATKALKLGKVAQKTCQAAIKACAVFGAAVLASKGKEAALNAWAKARVEKKYGLE